MYYFNKTIKDGKDIFEYLDLDVLGDIPLIKNINNQLIDYSKNAYSSECLRLIRANLLYYKTILITSSNKSEGKSYVAANLANILAYSNLKVLLISADLRKHDSNNIFNIKNKKGLSDYIQSISSDIEIDIRMAAKFINTTKINNLHYMSEGSIYHNPSKLFSSENMKSLLYVLKNMYDIIIFDAPTCSLYTDAVTLASVVDETVLVIESRKSKVQDILDVKKSIENADGNLIGAILNKKESNQLYDEECPMLVSYDNDNSTFVSVKDIINESIVKIKNFKKVNYLDDLPYESKIETNEYKDISNLHGKHSCTETGSIDEILNDFNEQLSNIQENNQRFIKKEINDINIINQIAQVQENNKKLVKEQLDDIKKSNNELLESIQNSNKNQLKNMQEANRVQFENLQKSNHEQLENMLNSNKKQLEDLKNSNRNQLENMQEANKVQFEDLKKSNHEQLENMQKANNEQLNSLKQSNKDQLASIQKDNKQQFENLQNYTKNQFDSMHNFTKTKLENMQDYNEAVLKGQISYASSDIKRKLNNIENLNKQQIENLEFTTKEQFNNLKEFNKNQFDGIQKTSREQFESIQKSNKSQFEGLRQSNKQQIKNMQDYNEKLLKEQISSIDVRNKLDDIHNSTKEQLDDIKISTKEQFDDIKISSKEQLKNMKTYNKRQFDSMKQYNEQLIKDLIDNLDINNKLHENSNQINAIQDMLIDIKNSYLELYNILQVNKYENIDDNDKIINLKNVRDNKKNKTVFSIDEDIDFYDLERASNCIISLTKKSEKVV